MFDWLIPPLILIILLIRILDIVATVVSLLVAAVAGTVRLLHVWFVTPRFVEAAVLIACASAASKCVADETLRKHDCRFLH